MSEPTGKTLFCFVAFNRLFYARFSYDGRFSEDGIDHPWFGKSFTRNGAPYWWMPFFAIGIADLKKEEAIRKGGDNE